MFRSRQKRVEEVVGRVLRKKEEGQMQRIAEALALRYVDDPQERDRRADKLKEKWEREDEAARHPRS